jgi:hypothetical protein
VVAVLVALSVILTTSVLYPGITAGQILAILAAFGGTGLALVGYVTVSRLRAGTLAAVPIDRTGRDSWRMPQLALLTRPPVPTPRKVGMTALRLYLAMATVLVIVKIVELAIGH